MADEKSIVPRYLYLIFDLRMTIYAIVFAQENDLTLMTDIKIPDLPQRHRDAEEPRKARKTGQTI